MWRAWGGGEAGGALGGALVAHEAALGGAQVARVAGAGRIYMVLYKVVLLRAGWRVFFNREWVC
jgi:hypothetical protein